MPIRGAIGCRCSVPGNRSKFWQEGRIFEVFVFTTSTCVLERWIRRHRSFGVFRRAHLLAYNCVNCTVLPLRTVLSLYVPVSHKAVSMISESTTQLGGDILVNSRELQRPFHENRTILSACRGVKSGPPAIRQGGYARVTELGSH